MFVMIVRMNGLYHMVLADQMRVPSVAVQIFTERHRIEVGQEQVGVAIVVEADVEGEFYDDGKVISWSVNTNEIIEFKYAISFINYEQAEKSLKQEIPHWEFKKFKENAKQGWNKVLNQIEVEGGTETRKRTFYTALYRCYERMIDVTENNRYYSNYDGKIHEAIRKFYVDTRDEQYRMYQYAAEDAFSLQLSDFRCRPLEFWEEYNLEYLMPPGEYDYLE